MSLGQVKSRIPSFGNDTMHIHILGICGTFMGGLAALAREAGHRVTGCDANVYPPMSDQLRALGIELIEGFDAAQLALAPDLFVVGNVVTRGNALMEAILDAGAPYTSGPQWLAEHVLQGRHVLAVAGTQRHRRWRPDCPSGGRRGRPAGPARAGPSARAGRRRPLDRASARSAASGEKSSGGARIGEAVSQMDRTTPN